MWPWPTPTASPALVALSPPLPRATRWIVRSPRRWPVSSLRIVAAAARTGPTPPAVSRLGQSHALSVPIPVRRDDRTGQHEAAALLGQVVVRPFDRHLTHQCRGGYGHGARRTSDCARNPNHRMPGYSPHNPQRLLGQTQFNRLWRRSASPRPARSVRLESQIIGQQNALYADSNASTSLRDCGKIHLGLPWVNGCSAQHHQTQWKAFFLPTNLARTQAVGGMQ